MLELTYTLKMVNPHDGQVNVSGRWHPNKRHFVCDMKQYAWFDFFVNRNCFENSCPNTLGPLFYVFKIVFRNNLSNAFLTKKQQKTVFSFCF
jgi:hypothetical protein